MKMTFIPIVFALVWQTASSAGETRKVGEMSFDMPSGGEVTVVADEGNITVTSWQKDEVFLKISRITWERNSDRAEEILKELKVKVDHSGDHLFVKALDFDDENYFRISDLFGEKGWRHHAPYRIDFELVVPEEMNLRLESDEGSVDLTGVSGEITVSVDEGNSWLRQLRSSDLAVEVDEGEVELVDIEGRINVHVDEGRVRLTNCRLDYLSLDADEGDIVLRQISVRDCRITTDEGDIEVELELPSDANCRIAADEGNIFVSLSDASDVSFELETEDGRIRSDFPFSLEEWGDDGARMRGSIGEGLARLSVIADEGNITIRQ